MQATCEGAVRRDSWLPCKEPCGLAFGSLPAQHPQAASMTLHPQGAPLPPGEPYAVAFTRAYVSRWMHQMNADRSMASSLCRATGPSPIQGGIRAGRLGPPGATLRPSATLEGAALAGGIATPRAPWSGGRQAARFANNLHSPPEPQHSDGGVKQKCYRILESSGGPWAGRLGPKAPLNGPREPKNLVNARGVSPLAAFQPRTGHRRPTSP